MTTKHLKWLQAASIRALRTVAQTALGMFSVGMAMDQINWIQVASVAVVSGIYSMLTSIATTLPELDEGDDSTSSGSS